jgi:ABC-2 type transport system permease protein
MILRAFTAFLTRDARQALSYRLSFLLNILSVFFSAATFYFVAQLFDNTGSPLLAPYGGAYFPFVLIGIAFSTYQGIGLNSFSQSLRQEQYLGTLEPVLATPVRIFTFLSGSALWDFLQATIEVAFYFVVAFLFFHLSLPEAHVSVAAVAVLLTLTTFMGLGVLAAAFILRFKQGNPVTWFVATTSELLGGVYFPTDILPPYLRKISAWVPMTHALQALRGALLSDATFSELSPHLIYLAVFTVLIWPLSIFAFKLALRRAQNDGTLGHY